MTKTTPKWLERLQLASHGAANLDYIFYQEEQWRFAVIKIRQLIDIHHWTLKDKNHANL